MGGFSLLGHLAGGYAQAAERERQRQFSADEQNRQNALGMVKILLENPAVPPEYKGTLIQHGMDVIHTPVGKKLPSFDKVMQSLPAVQTPAKTQNAPIPPVSLSMPAAPPNPQGLGTGAAPAQGAPSLTQGATQANGGSFPVVAPPPIPLPAGTSVPGPTIPGAQQAVTLAPQQVAPAGQLHVLTPAELAQQQQIIEQNRIMEMARTTGLTPAQLMGIKPQFEKLTPGEEMRDVAGNLVAKNESMRQGLVRFEPKFGPGGEFVGVEDKQGNKLLVGDELLRNPEARDIAKAAMDSIASRESRVEAKENRQQTRAIQQQARAFAQQAKMFEQRETAKEEALSNTTKTMVEAAPKVLDLTKRVRDLIDKQEAELGPAAGRWNEFMTGKIGAPNEDFARLRTNVSLLQTLLMRMHTGARGGQYIMQHFTDLVNAGKQSPENLRAALDEIDQYANDVNATPRGMFDKNAGPGVSNAGAKTAKPAPGVTHVWDPTKGLVPVGGKQ